jgi:serine O-acetyltransferase
MLHRVTLGGTGTRDVIRHPRIGDGVLLGAGATLLGPITVGDGAHIGACSMVLENIPPHAVAVGVPAKVINRKELKTASNPASTMETTMLQYEI